VYLVCVLANYFQIHSDNTLTKLELEHIQAWADDNNLRMNATKSKEIIF